MKVVLIVCWSSCYSSWILKKLGSFFDTLSQNTQISNFMNVGPLGAELFHADGRIDRHDEAYTRNFANGSKKILLLGDRLMTI